MKMPPAKRRLIVALDVESTKEARVLVTRLGDAVGFYKIGLELLYAGGLELARELIDEGYDVFIDAKLHDIPNTVERAARKIASLGPAFLTVHAYPQTMRAALAGCEGKTKVLGVTLLTSMSAADAKEAGYDRTIADIVTLRAEKAKETGIAGIVCSPMEAQATRSILGPKALVVTPGIRFAEEGTGDQARIATPQSAFKAGASHIVVGRPITRSLDPRAAATRILSSMELEGTL